MEEITLSRNDLYDLVWSEPFSSIAKKYEISDADGLKKTCLRLNIPIPELGYWQRFRNGRQVFVPELPTEFEGDSVIRLIPKIDGTGRNIGEQSPMTIRQYEIENDPKVQLTIPASLTNPDKLISAVKDTLSRRRPGNTDGGLVHSQSRELDIRVTPANLSRSLRFMDAFIKAVRVRGHEFKPVNESYHAIINKTEFLFKLGEKIKRVEKKVIQHSYDKYDYQATGLLYFGTEVSYNKKEWSDGKQTIEEQLSKILAYLEVTGENLWLEEQRIEKERLEKIERDKQLQELEKKIEKELSEFKALLIQSRRWQKVKILREYLDDFEKHAIAENRMTPEFEAWLAWSRKKADWYDPFLKAEDELLKTVNRNRLVFKKTSWPYTWGR